MIAQAARFRERHPLLTRLARTRATSTPIRTRRPIARSTRPCRWATLWAERAPGSACSCTSTSRSARCGAASATCSPRRPGCRRWSTCTWTRCAGRPRPCARRSRTPRSPASPSAAARRRTWTWPASSRCSTSPSGPWGPTCGRSPARSRCRPTRVDREKVALAQGAGRSTGSASACRRSIEAEAAAVWPAAERRRTSSGAWTLIGRSGFPILNIDLIYGLPGQTVATWLYSLRAGAAVHAGGALPVSAVRPAADRAWGVRAASGTTSAWPATARRGSSCWARATAQVSMRMFRARDAPGDGRAGLLLPGRRHGRPRLRRPVVHAGAALLARLRRRWPEGSSAIIADYLASDAWPSLRPRRPRLSDSTTTTSAAATCSSRSSPSRGWSVARLRSDVSAPTRRRLARTWPDLGGPRASGRPLAERWRPTDARPGAIGRASGHGSSRSGCAG